MHYKAFGGQAPPEPAVGNHSTPKTPSWIDGIGPQRAREGTVGERKGSARDTPSFEDMSPPLILCIHVQCHIL